MKNLRLVVECPNCGEDESRVVTEGNEVKFAKECHYCGEDLDAPVPFKVFAQKPRAQAPAPE